MHHFGAETQGFQGIVDQIDVYISRFLDTLLTPLACLKCSEI